MSRSRLRGCRVTLASNVNHSVYAALALSGLGVLDRYLGPVVLAPDTTLARVMPTRFSSARTYPQVSSLAVSRLWEVEVGHRAAGLFPSTVNQKALRHSRLMDAAVMRRMGRPDVLHVNTAGLVRSVREARRRGTIVIADHRDVHPADHAYVDPLAERLVEEFRVADWVIANSDFAAESLARNGVDEARIAVLPLGADLEFFSPAPLVSGRRHRPKSVLFVGSMSRRKGCDLLFQAFASPLLKDVGLRLVGPAPDPSWDESLRSLPNARLCGPRTRAELLLEYRQADLLVLPSRIDAFGLVAVEAMACGTPVVVSTGCGVAGLVHDHAAGRVVPRGDPDALAEAVVDLLSCDSRHAAAGRGAIAAARSASWARYGERLGAWYDDVLMPWISTQERD